MTPVKLGMPDLTFNPITIATAQIISQTEVKLKVIQRFVDLNSDTKVVSLYAQLTDNNISLIVPIRYYEWLALGQTQTVLCMFSKVQIGSAVYGVVEITDFQKANLDTAEQVLKPFHVDNLKIPDIYYTSHKESESTSTMLNCYQQGLAFGLATATFKGHYIKAMCTLDRLLSNQQGTLVYREIQQDNVTYYTDLEVK